MDSRDFVALFAGGEPCKLLVPLLLEIGVPVLRPQKLRGNAKREVDRNTGQARMCARRIAQSSGHAGRKHARVPQRLPGRPGLSCAHIHRLMCSYMSTVPLHTTSGRV